MVNHSWASDFAIVWICGTVLELFIPEPKGIEDALMAIFKPILDFINSIPFLLG